jgi:hypothetical protein
MQTSQQEKKVMSLTEHSFIPTNPTSHFNIVSWKDLKGSVREVDETQKISWLKFYCMWKVG